MTDDRIEDLRTSWVTNADAWTTAVRDGAIASRRLGTDAAALAACARVTERVRGRAPRALDLGCGEGWLARALAANGADAMGIDASEALVERAREAGGDARYEAVSYEALRDDPTRVPGPFDLVVCNFALLDDAVAATLATLGARLSPDGRLVIQTLHPWVAEGPYADGWRVETFAAFASPFPAHMPWYFRTLGSWVAALGAASLRLETLEEPPHPETGKPLSLLLTCTRR